MKLFKYGLPLAALAVLASCSNDKLEGPAPEQVGTPTQDSWYVSFNLKVPTSMNSTRAGETYNDGAEDEYAINDMWLYLYRVDNSANNDTEEYATLWKSVQLGNLGTVVDDDDEETPDYLTSTTTATFQLTGTTDNPLTEEDKTDYNYYAFIVVNKPTNFKEPETGKKFSEWLNWAQSGTTENYAHLYSETGKTVASVSGNSLNWGDEVNATNEFIPQVGNKFYFTMMNAPIYKNSEVLYLAELTTENFATSPKQAKKAAATVYVQRGVAKVSISDKLAEEIEAEPVDDEDDTPLGTVSIDGWALDVVNTKAFPVQKIAVDANNDLDDDWYNKDWFLSDEMHTGDKHIYWSLDPNYYNTYTANSSRPEGHFREVSDESDFHTVNSIQYCMENTMKAQAMQKNQSTRIVFEATFKLPDADEASDFIMFPGTDKAVAVKSDDLKKEGGASPSAGEIALNELIKADDATIKDYMEKLGMAKAEDKVLYYPGGKTYYTAIIRHFVGGTDQPGLGERDVKDLSEYKEDEDLGRYGLVRNNWYVANVGKVFGYGVPTVPTPDDTPDDYPDPIKYNALLDIEVVAWTVRGYDYTIK